MGKIIAIANQKGGTGKTTTAWAILTGARIRGLRTLGIDFDPQGSLTFLMDPHPAVELQQNLTDALSGRCDLLDAVQRTPYGDLVPATTGISTLADVHALDKLLQPIWRGYDLIVIDSPPTLGKPLLAAILAAREIIIPLQADPLSIQGLYQMRGCMDQLDTPARVFGCFLSRYSDRSTISREMARALRERCAQLGFPYLDRPIREGVAIREAQLMCQDIFTYAPRSKQAADYAALLDALHIVKT